jgi:tyrosine-protein phosphatase YwqE
MLGWGGKKRVRALAFLEGDMHSHLLPGIDDGAADEPGALSLIRSLKELGYERLVTTPHIYSELYPNTRESLQSAHDRLKPVLDFPLRYAAEYYLDDHVDSLLQSGEPLLTIHENWVLTEISFIQPPPDLDRRLFDLQMAGYKPILAHPERYTYWQGNKQVFGEFKEKGMLLQVNLLSLTGYYGRAAMDTARYLIREEMVDLAGTDCHHERHIAILQKEASVLAKWLEPLVRKGKLLNPLV